MKFQKIVTSLAKVLGVILALSSCSNSSEESLKLLMQVEPAAQLTRVSGEAAFGTVAGNKIVIFKVQNTGDAVSEIPTPSLIGTNADDFSIVYTQGCSSPLVGTAACSIRVLFSSVAKSAGSYVATLKVGTSLEITLSASVAASSAVYQVLDGAVPIESLNLGNISRTQNLSKYLSLKNIGSTDSPPVNLTLSNSAFTLASNGCQGKILKPQQICGFMVNFSTLGKTPALYLADLEFAAVSLPLSGTVLTVPPAGEEGSDVVIETYVSNELLTEADFYFGIFPQNQGVVKVITFKNVGTKTSEPLTAMLNEPGNFALVSNSCVNKVLPPQMSCSLRVVFSALGKSAGDYSVHLEMGGASPELGATVLSSNACPENFHLEAPVCVNNVQACDYENGTGQQHWTGSLYSDCYAIACASGYDLVGDQCLLACAVGEHRHPLTNSCELDIQDCQAEVAHATAATKTWNGFVYGACIVSACEAAYEISSDSLACLDPTQFLKLEIAGDYQLERSGEDKLRIRKLSDSSIVLDEFGAYIDDENNNQVCKVELLELELASGVNLQIAGDCSWALFKVATPVVLEGNLLANYLPAAGTYQAQDFTNQLLSFSVIQALGGSGDRGGVGWDVGWGEGAASIEGNGGGGGSGGPMYFYQFSSPGQITYRGTGNDAIGQIGGPGTWDPTSTVRGGTGGNGGDRGTHGQGVYFEAPEILGNGLISVSGSDGADGATGGNAFAPNVRSVFSGGGGGGGGGAGGSGGKLLVKGEALSLQTQANAGVGGSGGAGGIGLIYQCQPYYPAGSCGESHRDGLPGTAGEDGEVGVIEFLP